MMTPEQAAAFVMGQAAAAFGELEGMKVENKIRETRGEAPAYGEGQFQESMAKYCIQHNQVIGLFNEVNEWANRSK